MKLRIVFITALALLFVLSGCGWGATGEATPTRAVASSDYPAPVENPVQTAYPAGESSTAGPSENALNVTQDPGLGAVQGRLLLKGKPVRDAMLYLGNIVTDDQGRELVAGYDRTSLMRGSTDEDGNFVIHNVPAGRYGLILDIVTQVYLMDTPDGSQSLLLTVENGKTTKLDVLDYQELPGL